MKDLMIILLCFVTLFLGTYRNAQGGITGGSGVVVMNFDAKGRQCVSASRLEPPYNATFERVWAKCRYSRLSRLTDFVQKTDTLMDSSIPYGLFHAFVIIVGSFYNLLNRLLPGDGRERRILS